MQTDLAAYLKKQKLTQGAFGRRLGKWAAKHGGYEPGVFWQGTVSHWLGHRYTPSLETRIWIEEFTDGAVPAESISWRKTDG